MTKHWLAQRKRSRLASQLDLSWDKQSANEYRPEAVMIKPKQRRLTELCLALGAVLITLAILFIHPLFQFTNSTIHITGLQQIDDADFRDAIQGILSNPILGFLPRNNYVLMNSRELHDILVSRFLVNEVHIHKTFPNVLSIAVTEKPPVIIYNNGQDYAIVGLTGDIVELAYKVDGEEFSHFPIVHNPNNSQPLRIKTNVLVPEAVQGILAWWRFVTQVVGVPVEHITLLGHNDASIRTKAGWEIRVHLITDFAEQSQSLAVFLRNKSITAAPLEYVDLRFTDRIFWQ